MSNQQTAEEIVEKYQDTVDGLQGDGNEFPVLTIDACKKAMQAHTTATLEELKAKVDEKLVFHAERRDEADRKYEYAHHHGIVEGMVKVKKLIGEAINE